MRFKKIISGYFIFSRKERNAAILLILLILITLAAPAVHAYFSAPASSMQYDSLRNIFMVTGIASEENSSAGKNAFFDDEDPENQKQQKGQYVKYPQRDNEVQGTLFPFDPNTVTAGELDSLGISAGLAKRILNYRNTGALFKRKEDLMKVYGFDEEEFNRLRAYIQIDSALFNAASEKAEIAVTINKESVPLHINLLDRDGLLKAGLDGNSASKIISCREGLGGFYSAEQLQSVYGVNKLVMDAILPYIVIDTDAIKKININTATFQQLAKHTYISDALAGAIIEYRNTTGRFSTVSELQSVPGMYPGLLNKLKPYIRL